VAAPPFQSELVNVYRPQGVVFVGIEKNTGSSDQQVVNFCLNAGWNFPAGRDAQRDIFTAYGTDRHNYMVIGRDGKIAHRAAGSYTAAASWTTYKQGLINALNAALLVPVEPTTWSRLKSLLN